MSRGCSIIGAVLHVGAFGRHRTSTVSPKTGRHAYAKLVADDRRITAIAQHMRSRR
jgi:delta 1-pyrroline-5-carboxylate dehydrogenase